MSFTLTHTLLTHEGALLEVECHPSTIVEVDVEVGLLHYASVHLRLRDHNGGGWDGLGNLAMNSKELKLR